VIPEVIVILFSFVFLMRIGTDPFSSAVVAVAYDGFETTGVLGHLFEVVREAT